MVGRRRRVGEVGRLEERMWRYNVYRGKGGLGRYRGSKMGGWGRQGVSDG